MTNEKKRERMEEDMATTTGDQLAQSIRRKIEELKKVCQGLDESTASCAPAGRWSPKEILSHLWGPEGSGHLPILQTFLGVNLSSPWPEGRGLLKVRPEPSLLPPFKGEASRGRKGEMKAESTDRVLALEAKKDSDEIRRWIRLTCTEEKPAGLPPPQTWRRPEFHHERDTMKIKRFFTVSGQSTFADVTLLFIRVVAGLAFTMHGWGKIQNPFGWMGPDGFAPSIFQALAAISEFGGGLAWIPGLLTPLASFGIASTMAVAFSSNI
jgi:DoxX